MPIFIYICPEGHETEFYKHRKDEVEPDTCKALVTTIQHKTNRCETFECGLPLEKIISGTNWKWTRGGGKNKNWPLE